MSGTFKIFGNDSFFCGTSNRKNDFSSEIKSLVAEAFDGAPAGQKPLWLRFHLSDIANQEELARKVLDDMGVVCALSFIGQAPLSGDHAALEACFTSTAADHPQKGRSVTKNGPYTHVWFNTPELSTRGSGPQMDEEFAEAEKVIASYGGSIADNLQRTWIYCRDIDNNYADLVTARRELFAERGLLPETHYITSTGIEGLPHPYYRLVKMDSMALFGNDPAQIRYLYAPEHLSPTHIYGVTFERATRIIYGDCSYYYISGTASIDKEGNVVHERDVEKQTLRLLENVEALMQEGGGSLKDLVQAVIYLRDPADYPLVKKIIDDHLPETTPRLLVRGSICRPTWLVEMDAIGANTCGDSRFAPLF